MSGLGNVWNNETVYCNQMWSRKKESLHNISDFLHLRTI